jgi:hypothetical protein
MLALVAAPVFAADKATGTFTVEGKTVRFTEVYASLERDPVRAGRKYLMLLVTDWPARALVWRVTCGHGIPRRIAARNSILRNRSSRQVRHH